MSGSAGAVDFDAAVDFLGFATQNGITGIFDPLTGTMALTGTSSLANYRTALRSVTFYNSIPPITLPRTVTYIGNDGDDDSIGVTSTVNVMAAPD